MKKAILAGGCFWCTEAVFQRVKGVEQVKSGFCGGHIRNPTYREVITQRTGHAEAVEITYDPQIVSFKELLMVFFGTHDPTTLNMQGYDIGTHYRSAIFYINESQRQTAIDYIDQLTSENAFENPIVTEIAVANAFYPADVIHYNYYNNHKQQSYCQHIISPKVNKLLTSYKEMVID